MDEFAPDVPAWVPPEKPNVFKVGNHRVCALLHVVTRMTPGIDQKMDIQFLLPLASVIRLTGMF